MRIHCLYKKVVSISYGSKQYHEDIFTSRYYSSWQAIRLEIISVLITWVIYLLIMLKNCSNKVIFKEPLVGNSHNIIAIIIWFQIINWFLYLIYSPQITTHTSMGVSRNIYQGSRPLWCDSWWAESMPAWYIAC